MLDEALMMPTRSTIRFSCLPTEVLPERLSLHARLSGPWNVSSDAFMNNSNNP